MPNLAYASFNQFLGLSVEATKGTYVAPAFYIPAESPEYKPHIEWLDDDAFRGSPVKTYQEIAGTRYDQVQIKSYLYPDTFPNLARGILGSTDTVTGTASPFTHTIGLLNQTSTGSQPPSYSLSWVDPINQIDMPGGQAESLSIAFNVEGKAGVDVTASWICNAGTVNTVSATPTFSSQLMVPSWNCSLTIGTVLNSLFVSGSIDIKRNTKAIFTMGNQSSFLNFSDSCAVTGKFTTVLQNSDPIFVEALTQAVQAMKLTFTDPNTGFNAAFQMSAVQFKNPVIDSKKPYVTLDTEYTAVGNTTDAVSGGEANIKFIGQNGQSTAY